MKVLKSANFEKREIVNAESCGNSVKDFAGKDITIIAGMTAEKVEDTDDKTKTVRVAYLVTNEAGMISSNSPTIFSGLESILDAYTADEIKAGLPATIVANQSSNKREYLTLILK